MNNQQLIDQISVQFASDACDANIRLIKNIDIEAYEDAALDRDYIKNLIKYTATMLINISKVASKEQVITLLEKENAYIYNELIKEKK
jgi:predicted polyphosphate/ATP-dependent NAD kinase